MAAASMNTIRESQAFKDIAMALMGEMGEKFFKPQDVTVNNISAPNSTPDVSQDQDLEQGRA